MEQETTTIETTSTPVPPELTATQKKLQELNQMILNKCAHHGKLQAQIHLAKAEQDSVMAEIVELNKQYGAIESADK